MEDMTPILAIYLSTAKIDASYSADNPVANESELLEYIARLTYAESMPKRKMVVFPYSDGRYVALHGPITNPIEYDYSTGRIDPDNTRELYCDPEPKHVEHTYYDFDISEGQMVIPEYHCLQVSGSWWVVDVDRTRGVGAIVATMDFVDNPEHNQGIHSRPGDYENSDNGSEFSKVLNENLPRYRLYDRWFHSNLDHILTLSTSKSRRNPKKRTGP